MRLSSILSKIFPSLIWRLKTHKKHIYLTFDDGPIPESTPWTLALLEKEGIEASFFCVGENVKKHPLLYKQILDKGHSVGNHTYNHLRGYTNNTDYYIENIAKARQYIDSNLFRPPYGMIKAKQIRLLKDYKIIMWDILSEDYRNDISNEQCLKRIIRQTRNGSIVLFHNNIKSEKKMRQILPRYIEFLKEKGYIFRKIEIF